MKARKTKKFFEFLKENFPKFFLRNSPWHLLLTQDGNDCKIEYVTTYRYIAHKRIESEMVFFCSLSTAYTNNNNSLFQHFQTELVMINFQSYFDKSFMDIRSKECEIIQ